MTRINFVCAIFLLLFITRISLAQTQTGSFTYDGLVRNYRIHLPTSCTGCTGLPLVVNLHGIGSNALQQEVYTGFNNISDTANFIVVYPDGIYNEWNIAGAGVDDVGLFLPS